MRRRTFVKSVGAAALATLSQSRIAIAHDTPYWHGHPGPASGTGSHQEGIGEQSFRKGSLKEYFQMPNCTFIVHHASMVKNHDFDVVDFGREQYPLWVRDDATIDAISINEITGAFKSRTAPYVRRGKSKFGFIRQYHGVKYRAYRNLMMRHGISENEARFSAKTASNYRGMRKKCLSSPNEIVIGYRGGSYEGMRPLVVDGHHPISDWETYPLWTETYGYIRRNSQEGMAHYQAFDNLLAMERDLDRKNWAAYLNT